MNKAKYIILETTFPDKLSGINNIISKAKLRLRLHSIELTSADIEALKLAKELTEFEIIKLWDKQADKNFIQFCAIYLDISTLLPLPFDKLERVYELIKIITLGYLGESWQIVRRFLIENEEEILAESVSGEWNERLIEQIFFSLFYTIRKNTWQDLKLASDWIERLRKEQKDFEEKYINGLEAIEKKQVALELASLYHLAKNIELLATFLIEGQPNDIKEQLDLHIDYSRRYCEAAGNIELLLLLQYLKPFGNKIIGNSLWTVAKRVNSRVTTFVKQITKSHKPIFELLYPQREAILEKGLLDQASKAVVVNLPTSSGKTVIAEFRILQALNQYADSGGWVAYAVPTRALVNQVAVSLQRDLGAEPLSLKIEKLSGALELDAYEEELLTSPGKKFDILVTTYEKLHLLVRQGVEEKMKNRPLSLIVVDEAHNIEEKSRGIGLELLLSTIKKDCNNANFLLLTPEIKNSEEIARWLDESSSKSISISLEWWQPNERVVGAIYPKGERRKITTYFKPLLSIKNTVEFNKDIVLGDYPVADYTFSELKNNKSNLAAFVASKLRSDENVLVIADSPGSVSGIAEKIFPLLDQTFTPSKNVELVGKFVAAELGDDYPLAKYLGKGLAMHSSALPEDIRFLIEDLMSNDELRVLVATTTIAQGINFPVSSIIMSSYNYRDKVSGTYPMPTRDFWNLVGRAGRMDQKSLGLVGITLNETKYQEQLHALSSYLSIAANDLASVLVKMVNDAMSQGAEFKLSSFFYRNEWSSFLQYISHMYKQSENLNRFVAEIELTLRRTFGFNQLSEPQKRFLSEKVKEYASSINKGLATLSDSTGFSTESIKITIGQLKELNFSATDWNARLLFSGQTKSLRKLVGVMLNTPEIRDQLSDIEISGSTITESTLSKVITDWVSGKDINKIAASYFGGEDEDSVNKATRAIYSRLVNSASWGLAALQKLPSSGLNFENLSIEEKRTFMNLPAMIYYGVNSDEAVLLRKQNVPRMVANKLGTDLKSSFKLDLYSKSSSEIIEWLNNLPGSKWQSAIPAKKTISGEEYKRIWQKLAGIA